MLLWFVRTSDENVKLIGSMRQNLTLKTPELNVDLMRQFAERVKTSLCFFLSSHDLDFYSFDGFRVVVVVLGAGSVGVGRNAARAAHAFAAKLAGALCSLVVLLRVHSTFVSLSFFLSFLSLLFFLRK